MKFWKTIPAATAVLALTAGAAMADTLDDVKARGSLKCIVTTGLAGFASADDAGVWTGLDVDFCRAVAAAVLNDSTAVEFIPTTAKERFTVLQSGQGDVLARNTTWTLSRDTQLGMNFVGVNFYDGQGFMVNADLGIQSAKELDGATVCVQTGTTTELNLADYFRRNNMSYESVVFETNDEARNAFEQGRCDAYTTDASGLAAERSVAANPSAYVILPDIISKEPLGPAVRQGDDVWFNVIRWTYFAMIAAEELGLTMANVDDQKANSQNPSVKRFLGLESDLGPMLKLDNDWAYRIVKQVGNYSESFDRNVGPTTPLGLSRGLNALWTDGGLMYAPPLR
ncbi:MAG: amino acid ABC transporter substrate-binding protein [Rhodospirillales bacterium]